MTEGSKGGRIISVHEMFHTPRSIGAGAASVAQVKDEARVLRGEAAEGSGRHAITAQEDLDLANEHSLIPLSRSCFVLAMTRSRFGDSDLTENLPLV
ncbi:hypothetical protein [Aurantiacibacter suaedae]|uniref:hypothetical protein n=1 Tax=Aurantiacibacter suaedae TaxID=2545755 RepID=UPI001386EC86